MCSDHGARLFPWMLVFIELSPFEPTFISFFAIYSNFSWFLTINPWKDCIFDNIFFLHHLTCTYWFSYLFFRHHFLIFFRQLFDLTIVCYCFYWLEYVLRSFYLPLACRNLFDYDRWVLDWVSHLKNSISWWL